MIESLHALYAGLSQVTYDSEPFDLGYGVVLRSTYAHLFAAKMMAFARATEGNPHPAPWRAARGGFSYDIEIELAVPTGKQLPGGLSAEDTVWLIAALLRLAKYAYLMVPVISDVSFEAAPTSKQEPLLRTFEIEPRILRAGDDEVPRLRLEDLSWVKSVWPRTAQLMRASPPLTWRFVQRTPALFRADPHRRCSPLGRAGRTVRAVTCRASLSGVRAYRGVP